MPNILALLDKSGFIKDRINSIVIDIRIDMEIGAITNKTEAFLRLRQEVEKFITELSSPTLEFREAYKMPVSSDINDMVTEASSDMNTLMDSIKNNTNIIESLYDTVLIEQSLLLSSSNYINKITKEFESSIDNIIDPESNFDVYREFFSSYDNIDADRSVSVNIDTNVEALTLGRVSVWTYESPYIEILNGSNGLPGDTHQASSIGGNIVHTGERDPHILLSNMTDTSKDTWFEYENIKLQKSEIENTNGYGFKYSEGLSWVTEDNKLVLKLYIELTNPNSPINYVLVNPYLPTDSAYIPAHITSIEVNNGIGLKNEVCPNGGIRFNRETAIIFDIQNTKSIIITFEQRKAYRTTVSHDFYNQVNINHNMLENKDIKEIRVNGIAKSSSVIGMRYEPSTEEYTQPNTKDTLNINVSNIFSQPEPEPTKISGRELLNAQRYQIGIRSIDLFTIEFLDYSEYVSKAYVFDTPISSVRLDVDDEFPSVFTGTINDWLEYWILVNEGDTWVKVSPFRATTAGAEVYVGPEATSIRVKIIIKRPITDYKMKYKSPVVYSYSVKGVR